MRITRKNRDFVNEVLEIYRKRNPEMTAQQGKEIEKINSWVTKNCVKYTAIHGKERKLYCGACGTEFDYRKAKYAVCPHCGRKLLINEYRSMTDRIEFVTQKLEKWGRFQAVRTYWTSVYETKGRKAYTSTMHVGDYMIAEDGRIIGFTRRLVMFLNNCYVPFNANPAFFMTDSLGSRTGWGTEGLLPYSKIQPWLKRYDILKIKGFDIVDVIRGMYTNPHFETMWKRGEKVLAQAALYNDSYYVDKLWPQIKIALRNGLRIRTMDEWREWRDLMDMYANEGKDIYSPKYNSPKDIHKAHQAMLRKRRAKVEKQIRERKRRDMIVKTQMDDPNNEVDMEYRQKMGALLGFVQTKDDITLRTLQSVKDFCEEGDTLHHCVFACHYFDHPDTLILDASVEGKRTETIEVNTKRWDVVQVRGKYDQDSEYHDRIVTLANDVIPELKKLSRQKEATTA